MPEPGKLGEDSVAVQAHLNIIQSVITRMASHCANCKAWCITLVSAILVIVADKGKPHYALIAIIPTALFFVLDSYYLALERCFIGSYNGFIIKLHSTGVEAADLYAVTPKGTITESFFGAIFSFSIWPFYTTLAGMIWIAEKVVIP